nr:snake venom 5'-nucleotidase [Biomphalaria glabrata]
MILAFVLSLTLSAVASEFQLTILHTNDVHARIEQTDINSAPCTTDAAANGKCFGGAARLRTKVQELRAKFPNVLLLDAGDQFQGTIWFYKFGGLAAASFMNLIQYDVMAIGNHEFDTGVAGLLPFVRNVSFPLISSNMNLNNTPSLQGLIKPSTVLTIGGQRIGVVGYTTTDTSFISQPETVTFTEELKAVQTEVDKLTALGINKIIALGHSGFVMDLELAKRLQDVDIVVGGHTNTFLYNGTAPSNEKPEGVYPTVLDSQDKSHKVLVIQDYAYGKYLGELHVTFDDQGKVTSWSGNPVLLDNSVPQDNETLDVIKSYLPEIELLKNTTIGRTNVDLMADRLQCRTTECNLGNVITDAMLAANIFTPRNGSWNVVSMAVTNAGSFRASIATGPITIENVIFTQPFRNTIDIITVKGQTIKDMFELVASKWSTETSQLYGGFLQVSGLQVTYDVTKAKGSKVVDIKVTCTKCQVPRLVPIDLKEEYNLLCGSFLYNGGDGLTMFPGSIIRKEIIGKIDTDVLIDYIKTYSPITLGLQGRIRHVQDLDNDKPCSTTSPNSAVAWQPSLFWTSLVLLLIIASI